MAGEEGKKKRFDRDFKIPAVKMVTEGGRKAAEVARSLGIHQNQLGIFVRLVLRKTNPAVNALEGNSLSLSVTARNL